MSTYRTYACVLSLLFVASCGGGSGGGSDNPIPLNDSGTDNGSGLVDEQDSSTLEKLMGPTDQERVWVCERTDADGGVRDTIAEFGELPQFNRAWVRFINPGSGTTDSLWRLTVNNSNDLDTFRLAVPGVERYSSFFLSEYDKRTRFFGDVVMEGIQSFTATYVERRSSGDDLRPEYRCNRSTRDQAIRSDARGWPANQAWPSTPDIQAVAGLRDNSSRWLGATDSCNDGSAIALQFIETFNGVETGARWPGTPGNFYIIDGARQGQNLSCAYGTDICYSASPRDGRAAYWGLNPALPMNERSCESCCYSCPLPGLASTEVIMNMNCN